MESGAFKFECDRCHEVTYVDKTGWEKEQGTVVIPKGWSKITTRRCRQSKQLHLCMNCSNAHEEWLKNPNPPRPSS